MSKPYYLAGPMTGIPGFNFPLFDRACAALRALGYDIVSPHENDTPAVQAAARASLTGAMSDLASTGETWAEMLARDVVLIGDKCDGIIFLPNWHKSRGAKLEAFTGLLTGKTFGAYVDGAHGSPVRIMDTEDVRCILREFMP